MAEHLADERDGPPFHLDFASHQNFGLRFRDDGGTFAEWFFRLPKARQLTQAEANRIIASFRDMILRQVESRNG